MTYLANGQCVNEFKAVQQGNSNTYIETIDGRTYLGGSLCPCFL